VSQDQYNRVLDIGAIFDRAGAVRRPPYHRLFNEVWSQLAYHPMRPDPAELPHGRGRIVLVIPAFLTNDWFTAPLRGFIASCGFRPFGWGLGVNWGPTPRLLAGLRERLHGLRREQGGPIAVVGVSLGGLLARDLAHDFPLDVRHVITLAGPSRLPTASTIEVLVRPCIRWYSPAAQLTRVATPLRVPSTSIYTRTDGIVAWESCRIDESNGEVFEVAGSHMTIGRNPEALRIVVQRLAD
jgi:pimeloyl-ACP methyl ester carboxylesterase